MASRGKTSKFRQFFGWMIRLPGALFHPRRLIPLSIVLLGAAFAQPLMQFLPDLDDRAEYRLETRSIVVSELPPWVPQDLVEQAVTNAGLPEEMSVLEDSIVEEIAGAFQMHPWVAKVNRVSKRVPAEVTVDLTFRQPIAMVQVRGGMYPVDAEGILLPPTDFSVSDTRLFPTITNAQSTPQGPAGTSWGDVSVIGAAALAKVLAEDWNQLDLSAIRIPRQATADPEIDDFVYQLVSQGGSVIIWGRFPGTEHPGELEASKKIGKLKDYLEKFDSFELPNGPYEIDIRHWRETSRRPLSTASRLNDLR